MPGKRGTERGGASSVAPVSNVSLRWLLHSLAGASSTPSDNATTVVVVVGGGEGAVVWCNYNDAHKRTRARTRGENPNTRAKDDLWPTGCAAPSLRLSVRPPSTIRGTMYGGRDDFIHTLTFLCRFLKKPAPLHQPVVIIPEKRPRRGHFYVYIKSDDCKYG